MFRIAGDHGAHWRKDFDAAAADLVRWQLRLSSQVADSRSGAMAAIGFSSTLVVGDKSRLKSVSVAPPIKLEF